MQRAIDLPTVKADFTLFIITSLPKHIELPWKLIIAIPNKVTTIAPLIKLSLSRNHCLVHTYHIQSPITKMPSLRSISSALRAPAQARARSVTHRQSAIISPAASVQQACLFHGAPASRLPYKDDQDRKSLKPQTTQGSVSGTDQEAAESDAAFDRNTTRPEAEKDQAEKGSGGNPLETSGADQSKSKPVGDSGVTRQENKKSSSAHSPEKKG